MQCSLIEEKVDENFDVEEDEEDKDVNDDQESSSDHYSCHGEKEDEEWLVYIHTYFIYLYTVKSSVKNI